MSIMFNAPVGVIDQYAQALRRIDKPWGYEIVWALTSEYCGKMLFVEAGHRLSLQFHRRKDETIYLHSGLVQIHIGDPAEAVGPATISPGRSFHIPPGVVHRIEAIEDSLLFEVSTPHLDDVVRIEDAYGRDDRAALVADA
jgi:mannose-6-phosphate isomerase-like protein (cupin superfamily)